MNHNLHRKGREFSKVTTSSLTSGETETTMEIFVTLKRVLSFFGLSQSTKPIERNFYLGLRIISLFILYSMTISGMGFVYFEAQTFNERVSAIMSGVMEVFNCTSYTVLFLQRSQFFQMFRHMERLIQQRNNDIIITDYNDCFLRVHV